MQRAHRAILSVVVIAFAAGVAALERWQQPAPAQDRKHETTRQSVSSGFDYYLIALSWSPTYCESNPHDREQCGARGYGFVLHGLWPQYERGSGPQDCASTQSPDRTTIQRTLAFMPSRRLIEHEWHAHGSCTGLDPSSYFEHSDQAFASIRIPAMLSAGARPSPMTAADISKAFVGVNPGLNSNMFAVVCRSRDLAEVRVCVDKDLTPRTCGRDVRTRCPRDVPLRIPLIR